MVAKDLFHQYMHDQKTLKKVMLAVVLGGVVIGAWFGYRYYTHAYNQRAHAAFERAVASYRKAGQGDQGMSWNAVEEAFAQGHKQFASSSLAPYFLAFQAEVAWQRKEGARSRDLLGQVLDTLSKQTPLYNAYAIKLALMQIDSGDEALVNKGQEALHALANDTHNQDRDMALYYEGLLAFNVGDLARAHASWDELIDAYGIDSTWSQVAQAKLAYSL